MSRRSAIAAVAAIVAVSVIARSLAAGPLDIPWIVPDEFLYAALGKSLWAHGQLAIRDEPVPFYTALVPLVGGWPFAAFGTARAITVSQWLDAGLISATAVPVYLWTRQLASRGWAVGAVALTLAAPGFLYSGLIMSEALFVPICVLAVWSLSHLLERPSFLTAGLFLGLVTLASAVRLQALIFVPVAVGAALWLAIGERSTAILRRLAPIAGLALLIGLATVVLVAVGGGNVSWNNALGAYADVAESRPIETSLVSGLAWQLVALAFAMLVVPFCALAAIAWAGLRRLPAAAGTGAFTAVGGTWTAAVLVQSALFTTAYTGTAAGRYLVTIAPITAIALCVWCARGAPARGAAVASAGTITALAVFVPVATIAGADAFSANPFAAPLTWLVEDGRTGIARAVLVALALVAVVVCLLLRAGRLQAVVVALVVGLVSVSVSSYVRAADAATAERLSTVGEGERAWVDSAASGASVAMLVTGSELWTGVDRTLFWNPGIRRLYALPAARSHPLVSTQVELVTDGTVLGRRGPLSPGLVLTSSTVQLNGELVATSPGRGSATYPWRLWRVTEPVRVVSVAELGVDPVGDLAGHVRITVPGCEAGALWITFIGKTDVRIKAFVNGEEQRTLHLVPGETPTVSFPSPPSADGQTPCVYDLDVPTLTGSTRLEFVPS